MISFPYQILLYFWAALLIGAGSSVWAQDKDTEINDRKIRALLITGGCDHDYETQKTIITAGISERCRHEIDWTVIHQGGEFENAKIEVYDKNDWAKGFDVVIHNECFTEVTDPDWVEKILQVHRDKTPAVLIHCTMLSYPVSDTSWTEFCGIKSTPITTSKPFRVQLSDNEHPVLKGLSDFTVTNEEVFVAESQSPSVRVLGSVSFPKEDQQHPVIWTNRYGENDTRVFATSLGNDNETMLRSVYLDILTKGFLWAINKDIEDSFTLPGSREGNRTKLLNLGDNLLSNQSARSSSSDAGKAIDGDPSTIWRQAAKGLINWWEGTLPGTAEIKAVAIYWESGNSFPYIIETSPDGKRWQTVVNHPASGIRQQVAFHEVSGTARFVRVSNPVSGLVSGIREIAAYSSIRQIPFHVQSAGFNALDRSSELSIDHRKPPASSQRRPVIPFLAFSILDNPRKSRQWQATLERLSVTFKPAAVDGLMDRVRQTGSGTIRNGAIVALANLYRNNKGETWDKSNDIAAFLESRFPDKKVDKTTLMSAILRREIPMRDLSRIMKQTKGKPALRELRLKLLQQNRITYNSLAFLGELVDDPAEDLETKMDAGTLLASSPDMLAMRDAFELAAAINSTGVEPSLQNSLLDTLVRNTSWEAQADWLASKSKGETAGERQLAWEILLFLLDDEEVRDPVKRFTRQHIADIESAGGNPLLSLVAVIDRSRNPAFRHYLERIGSRESSIAATSAREALDRLNEPAPTVGELSPRELETMLAKHDQKNRTNGELIYRRNCRKCHDSGPDLRSLDQKFSTRNEIVAAILNPDQNIADGFRSMQFSMKDGNSYSGFVSRETSQEIKIIDQANNAAVLKKKNITKRTPIPQSMMPIGIADHLPIDHFADLLFYLEGL